MNTLKTLIFPDTDIVKERLYPLFLLSSPLYFLQPVEPSPDQQHDEPDLFTERGLCQALTPAPLGDNRERFLRLVDDIKNRKDDYAAQLSSLTVASMSASKPESSNETRSQILSTLLKNHEVTSEGDLEKEIELWQARLVLAIGELLEREEEELRQNLNFLDDRELEMFQKLQGDGDNEGDDLIAKIQQVRDQLESRRPREVRLQFKAWLKLMSFHVLPETLLWCATSTDGADEVFNELEKRTSHAAVPILKLALPGIIPVGPVHLVNQVEAFRLAAEDIYQVIARDLTDICSAEYIFPTAADALLPGNGDYVAKWNNLVEEHFPASSHNTGAVTFYLLPEHRVAELLSLKTEDQEPLTNGLLAVLQGS